MDFTDRETINDYAVIKLTMSVAAASVDNSLQHSTHGTERNRRKRNISLLTAILPYISAFVYQN